MQQDTNPKHTSQSAKNGRSPDLNPIEMLWKDLKRAIHAKKPTNIPEFKLFCKEEWAKIPPS
ncbi:hypothetical protein LDENG_00073080 [Lucifuga dentata]|nr:hypothetical protein LDENG_00073080 [Lucifuga dentata]